MLVQLGDRSIIRASRWLTWSLDFQTVGSNGATVLCIKNLMADTETSVIPSQTFQLSPDFILRVHLLDLGAFQLLPPSSPHL